MRNIFVVIILSFLIVACGDGLPHATVAELEASTNSGYRDAINVCQTKANSMERERAILSIRARETKLRQAGYFECADAYVSAAEKVLRDSAIIQ